MTNKNNKSKNIEDKQTDEDKQIDENKKMEQKNNTLMDFIKHEDKYFIEFLSNFEIIGLTIASIIGLSITSLSKTFTNEIIMRLLEPLLSVSNWKNYRFKIGNIDLGIGLFTSDIINLLIVAFVMFIVYSFFKIYVSRIIDNKSSWRNKLVHLEKINNNQLNTINDELRSIKEVLLNQNK